MHEYVKRVAEKYDLKVLDLFDYWKGMPAGERKKLYLAGGQGRLSSYGMEESAKELFKYLTNTHGPLLNKKRHSY